jgi:hypothetical protein
MDIEKFRHPSHCRQLAMLRSLVDRIHDHQMRWIYELPEPPFNLAAKVAPTEAARNLEHGALDRTYSISPLHNSRPG